MIKKLLALTALALMSTVLDQLVIHHGFLNLVRFGWAYIFVGWFIVWVICKWVLKSWLLSIAAVFTLSITEGTLFLLWDRIAGRIPWEAQWYQHDWMIVSQNWWIPSHYVYQLGIAGLLVILWRYRR